MTIERSLQICVAVMASLGTLLLGMGARNALLPMATLVVAVSSLYLTDKLGWVQLNRNVASLAAVAAVCISVVDFFQMGSENQLLAIAYLLIYLQIVLMLQRKDVRVYWQLLMLSLLQVVVASALNFGLGFGTLLIVYMFVGLLALALFFAHREFVKSPSLSGDAAHDGSGAPPATLTADNVVIGGGGGGAAGELDGLLRRGIWRRTLQMGAVTLACTFTVFFLLPRFGDDSTIRQIAGQRMVGFNDTVTLGRLGTVIESADAVMRVWFKEEATGDPYLFHGPPYFRGAVLNHYNAGTKSWSFKPPGGVAPNLSDFEFTTLDANSSYVRETISLEPAHEGTICTIYPSYTLGADNRVTFSEHNQQIVRRVSPRTKLNLTLVTTGFYRGVQKKIVPLDRTFDPFFFKKRDDVAWGRQASLNRLTDYPGKDGPNQPLQQLVATARTVLQDANLPADDVVGRAEALAGYLRDSGRFIYKLGSVDRDPTLDPIEDFITQNRQGHCEYFASALTLMLRSQGIPARMIVGFKGGEWNSLGGYYQVRQLHAHSWVEVFVENYSPPGTPAASPNAAAGGWLRLDPSPGVGTFVETTEALSFGDHVNEWINYVDFLWSSYVVELDAKRQKEAIYDSLATAGGYVQHAVSKDFWTEDVPDALAALDRVDDPVQVANRWLSWRAGLLTIAILLIVVVVYRNRKRLTRLTVWLAARLAGAFGKQKTAAATIGRRAPVVEFYRRLESILRRHGIRRPAGQTQHEFAVAVGGQLVENRRRAAAAAIPRQVVDVFYRVRFGGQTIAPQQQEEIERALDRLSAALKETQ